MDSPCDVVAIAGRSTLWLDSERIDECMEYFEDRKIDILGVSPVRGFKEKDLEFLRRFPRVQRLTVVPPASHDFDLAPVFELKELRELTLNQNCSHSLTELPNLQMFRGYWSSALNLGRCANLRVLYISGYKADLTNFPAPPLLEDFSLVQSPIKSLEGIARLQGLQRLELAYLTKLEHLDAFPKLENLRFLELNKCNKVKGHSVVSTLKNLRVLRFNDCGSIPNLKFINEMENLEEFRFVNTLIEDGDLRPLLRLQRVGFLPKKGYSHSPIDFGN